MGKLMVALMEKLFEAIFDRGVEAVGEQASNRVFRRGIWVLALASSVWVAVSNGLLWQTDRLPGVSGLAAYVQDSGPNWLLAAIIVPGVAMLWLLLPLKGKDVITFILAAATFAVTLGSLAEFQGGGRYGLNAPALLSFLASLLLVIFGVVLALTDVPPLDASLARFSFVYWGRYRHLLALRQYGVQHGCMVSGPAGKEHALTIEGRYDPQRAVSITSAAKYSFTGNTPTYTVSAKLGSPRDIVAFRISYEPTPKKLHGQVPQGETRGAPGERQRPIYFYVIPADPATRIPVTFLAEMAAVVEAGRPVLGRRDFVRATPFGLRYTHPAVHGLSVRDAQLDPTLAWMRSLMSVLEPISPAPVEAASSRQTSSF